MSAREFSVSLRIRHPDIGPAEIGRLVGLDAQHSWKAGQSRRGPGGESREGRYRETYWMTTLSANQALSTEGPESDSALRHALTQLRQASRALCELNERGATIELHVRVVGAENLSLDLNAEALALLGRMGVRLFLEVDSEDENEEEQGD